MFHPDAPPLPAWVLLPNGRLIPFEPDQVSEDLYLSSVKMGNPDPFLVRELTDGVVFTLAAQNPGATLKSDFLIQEVSKTLRNFGHSELASVYEKTAFSPFKAAINEESLFNELLRPVRTKSTADMAREKMLLSVFTPDISGAIQDGWVQMDGITFPDGLLNSTWTNGEWLPLALNNTNNLGPSLKALAGKNILLVNPEIHFQHCGAIDHCSVRLVLQRLEESFLAEGISGTLHVNHPHSPGWFRFIGNGPLFSHLDNETALPNSELISDTILRVWISLTPSALRLHWHGTGKESTETRKVLDHLSRTGRNWAYSPGNQANWYSRGITQDHPAILDKVYLRLDRLAKACLRKGILDKFSHRLPSLVRLGISAGNQKRAFLRKLETHRKEFESAEVALSKGFQLEKARLIIAPKGLPELLEAHFPGEDPYSEGVLKLARGVLKEIRSTITAEERKTPAPLILDLSHLLEVKESKIKDLAEKQREKPRTINFGSKGSIANWLNEVGQSGDWIDLLNPSVGEKDLDWISHGRKLKRIHSIHW